MLYCYTFKYRNDSEKSNETTVNCYDETSEEYFENQAYSFSEGLNLT